MTRSTKARDAARDVILEATLETIADKKIAGTGIREIARRADMSQSNLLYHFSNKETLLLALLDKMLNHWREERKEVLASMEMEPCEKLEYIFRQELESLKSRGHIKDVFIDFWVQGTENAKIRQKIQTLYDFWRSDYDIVIDEGVRLGEFDAEQAPIASNVMIALMEGISLQYLSDPDTFDLERHFDAAYQMLVQLLCEA